MVRGGEKFGMIVAVRTLQLETFVGFYSTLSVYCWPLWPDNLDGDISSDVHHPFLLPISSRMPLLHLLSSAAFISHDASRTGQLTASQLPLLSSQAIINKTLNCSNDDKKNQSYITRWPM